MVVIDASWDEEAQVRALVRRCGRYVRTYSGIRDIRKLYDAGSVYVAVDTVGYVGFCVCRHNVRVGHSTIYEIGVDPDYRRQGIAAALIDRAMHDSPHGELWLVCDARNTQALAFYARLGFERLGQRVNRAGEIIVDLMLAR